MICKSSDLVKEGIEIALLTKLSLCELHLFVGPHSHPLFSFGALLIRSKAYVSVGIHLVLLFEDCNLLPNSSLKPPFFLHNSSILPTVV